MPKKPFKTGSRPFKHNSFVDTVYNLFKANPYRSLTLKQTAASLGINDVASRQLVQDILIRLVNQGLIHEGKRGKYGINPDAADDQELSNVVIGKVDMKKTGNAYILLDQGGEDVHIASNNTLTALHGDKVKVHLFPSRSGRKREGQIIEVLKRDKDNFVGIIEVQKTYAFLIPDNQANPVEIFVPHAALNGARNGQKVIVRITEWPNHSKNPFGEVIEILGEPGNHEVEMHAVLAEFGFAPRFPAIVEREAETISEEITHEEVGKRRDFRDVFTCTIDPVDAKDFDDALSLRVLEDGNFEVGVHIADVSYYVKPGSKIDAEALNRGTSVYLVDRTVPMLPEKLSNMLCSLRPAEDKLCFAVVFTMSPDAKVIDRWFGRTVIHSDRRYAYEEVQEMIEGGEGDFKEQLMIFHNLAVKLRQERFRKGSIAFSSREVKFILDENARPVKAFIKQQKEANHLIEEFMLLANKAVAELIGRRQGEELPRTFVYRIHDEPNLEKLQTFSLFLGRLGYKISLQSKRSIAASLNSLFQSVEGKGEENLIETIAIRTMAKAEYSTKNIGHYGLSFPYYTHFTSPIRRYPDLMVHRLLHHYLNNGKSVSVEEYEPMCKHSSEMERKAQEAERASVAYKQAEYLLDKIGQTFSGLISGVSKWGIYVELDENKAEGMVSLRSMNDDYYYLDEDNYRVIGQRKGHVYRLGDPVKIMVQAVDIARRQMDFLIV
jgi:ribonuclease R